ncbi:uncharacterized protein LOC141541851 [Sminthopsis crassicaudata]|uniref:uncharacterized protein LOC141541851 n=1 Tax=Sminthopsis crassicaudata TaxID=9301 RepID=UPI003D699E18
MPPARPPPPWGPRGASPHFLGRSPSVFGGSLPAPAHAALLAGEDAALLRPARAGPLTSCPVLPVQPAARQSRRPRQPLFRAPAPGPTARPVPAAAGAAAARTGGGDYRRTRPFQVRGGVGCMRKGLQEKRGASGERGPRRDAEFEGHPPAWALPAEGCAVESEKPPPPPARRRQQGCFELGRSSPSTPPHALCVRWPRLAAPPERGKQWT